MKTETLSIPALRDAIAQLPDDRLATMRRHALEQLGEHGLPTRRDEDWKYTDLSSVIDLSNQWLADSGQDSATAELPRLIESIRGEIDAAWLVISNGRIDKASLVSFEEAGAQAELLSRSDIELESAQPLTQFNTALLRDGLVLRVKDNVTLPRPVGILVVDAPAASGSVSQARVDIEMSANSRADLVEYHVSRGDARSYCNSVVNLDIGDGAAVNYVRIQNRARYHDQTGRLNVRLARDSRFKHCAFDLGGAFIRNDLHVSVDGPGAAAAFDGLYLGGSNQHIDNHTRVDHRMGPAQSQQEYRGIATGNARCIWNGKVIVHAGADGTDASQANHNLLLSDDAEIDAKPELEIYADDVKCSHGTTIGQLDETSLYYLRTRGLDKTYAQKVLTRAFAHTIVSRTSVPVIGDNLAGLIETRLDQLLAGLQP